MICKINNININYNRDFLEENSELFEILRDENHYVYWIKNNEFEDLILFISPTLHKTYLLDYSYFETKLKKSNKFLFLNISKIFSEIIEGPIFNIKIISYSDFLDLLDEDIVFDTFNEVVLNETMYLFFPENSQVGKATNISEALNKKIFLKKLKKYNIDIKENMIYNKYDNKLYVINKKNGYITILDNRHFNYEEFNKYLLSSVNVIDNDIDKIYLLDIRQYLLRTSSFKRLNYLNYEIKDNNLYLCFLEDYNDFSSIEEASKYKFNHLDYEFIEDLKVKFELKELFYLSNRLYKHFLMGLDFNNKIKLIDFDNLDINCTQVMEKFDLNHIININDLSSYITGFKYEPKLKEESKNIVELGDYIFWIDYFEKKLRITKKTNKKP